MTLGAFVSEVVHEVMGDGKALGFRSVDGLSNLVNSNLDNSNLDNSDLHNSDLDKCLYFEPCLLLLFIRRM